MLSGLRHLDERVQPDCKSDYVSDPNTGEVVKTCPRCNFYLRDYLLHLMQKTDFVPSVERFFCCGCLTTKKIPPPGYGKFTATCGACKQLVTESGADMITFLACCCSAKCSGAELDP